MTTKLLWLVVRWVTMLVIALGICYCWASRKQIGNAIIDVYLKIVCEK